MAQRQTPAAWRGNGGWLAKAVVEERPLSNKSNRARQDDVLTAPLSREERQRRHANQAAMRRWENARAITVAAFAEHRGGRLSINALQHPTVPPTRRAR
jgi:hypothetical protein